MTNSVESNLMRWIKELKDGKPCLPHDSYDGGCCDGNNEDFRQELIKKLESLFKDI